MITSPVPRPLLLLIVLELIEHLLQLLEFHVLLLEYFLVLLVVLPKLGTTVVNVLDLHQEFVFQLLQDFAFFELVAIG